MTRVPPSVPSGGCHRVTDRQSRQYQRRGALPAHRYRASVPASTAIPGKRVPVPPSTGGTGHGPGAMALSAGTVETRQAPLLDVPGEAHLLTSGPLGPHARKRGSLRT